MWRGEIEATTAGRNRSEVPRTSIRAWSLLVMPEPVGGGRNVVRREAGVVAIGVWWPLRRNLTIAHQITRPNGLRPALRRE